MKKNQRVCKNYEFDEIIKKRQFIKTPAFVLYFRRKKEDSPRVGISVGKKLGNAVVRNRTKRQARALVDEIYDFDEPFDTILIVRPAWLKTDYQMLSSLLANAKNKAKQRMLQGDSTDEKDNS